MPASSASRLWSVIVVGAALTSTMVGTLLQWRHWRPEILVASLVYLGLTSGRTVAVIMGFFAGLYADLHAPQLLGTHSLAHSVTAYLAGLIGEKIQAERFSLQALSLFVLSVVDDTIVGFAAGSPSFFRFLLYRTVPSAVYTTVLALVLVAFLRDWLLPQTWIHRATSRRRRVR